MLEEKEEENRKAELLGYNKENENSQAQNRSSNVEFIIGAS